MQRLLTVTTVGTVKGRRTSEVMIITHLLFWFVGFEDISLFIRKLHNMNTILEHCQGKYHIAFSAYAIDLYAPQISLTDHNLGHFTINLTLTPKMHFSIVNLHCTVGNTRSTLNQSKERRTSNEVRTSQIIVSSPLQYFVTCMI